MEQPIAVVGCAPVARPWTVREFMVIWLAGVVGTVVLGSAALVFGNDDMVVLFGLAGQYLGNLGVFWLYRREGREDVGFRVEGSDFVYVGLGVIFQIAIALLFLPLTRLLFPEGETAQEVVDMITEATSLGMKLTVLLAAVLFAPVTEELMFRGVLLKALERRGRRFALMVSALVFAAAHLLGLDTTAYWQSAVVVLPQVFLLGLVLAWVTQRSGRLGPAILLHSGFNLLAALLLLIPPDLLEQVV